MGYTVQIKAGAWPFGEQKTSVVYEGREFVHNGKYRPVRVVAVLRSDSSINNLHSGSLETVEFVVERAAIDAMGGRTWSTWLHASEHGEYMDRNGPSRLEEEDGLDGAVFADAMAAAMFGPDVVVDQGPYEGMPQPPPRVTRPRARVVAD